MARLYIGLGKKKNNYQITLLARKDSQTRKFCKIDIPIVEEHKDEMLNRIRRAIFVSILTMRLVSHGEPFSVIIATKKNFLRTSPSDEEKQESGAADILISNVIRGVYLLLERLVIGKSDISILCHDREEKRKYKEIIAQAKKNEVKDSQEGVEAKFTYYDSLTIRGHFILNPDEVTPNKILLESFGSKYCSFFAETRTKAAGKGEVKPQDSNKAIKKPGPM